MTFDPDFTIRHPSPVKTSKAKRHKKSLSGKMSKGRVIRSLEENLTPSQANITNVAQGVLEHGGRRVEVFDYFIQRVHGIAVRSNGQPMDIKGFVEGAHLQQGKGSKEKETHAAHVFPLAGFRENYKLVMVDQIVEEENITPQKKKYLEKVGATAQQIQDIYDHIHDPDYVVDKIIEIAPGPSCFSHTYIEEVMNTTDELPEEVNLSVDCPLEKLIRPQVADLIIRCMKAEVTVQEARHEFVRLVSEGLTDIYEILRKNIQLNAGMGLPCERLERITSYVCLELNGTMQAAALLDS